mmetsp:Transcript_14777/g.35677  ORF Transcript_14777/g.35677 Transcript_14777/m.35677 type:complete len:448 (-) Transcript_14777:247-1590(-)
MTPSFAASQVSISFWIRCTAAFRRATSAGLSSCMLSMEQMSITPSSPNSIEECSILVSCFTARVGCLRRISSSSANTRSWRTSTRIASCVMSSSILSRFDGRPCSPLENLSRMLCDPPSSAPRCSSGGTCCCAACRSGCRSGSRAAARSATRSGSRSGARSGARPGSSSVSSACLRLPALSTTGRYASSARGCAGARAAAKEASSSSASSANAACCCGAWCTGCRAGGGSPEDMRLLASSCSCRARTCAMRTASSAPRPGPSSPNGTGDASGAGFSERGAGGRLRSVTNIDSTRKCAARARFSLSGVAACLLSTVKIWAVMASRSLGLPFFAARSSIAFAWGIVLSSARRSTMSAPASASSPSFSSASPRRSRAFLFGGSIDMASEQNLTASSALSSLIMHAARLFRQLTLSLFAKLSLGSAASARLNFSAALAWSPFAHSFAPSTL